MAKPIWFKIGMFGNDISAVTVDKVTDHRVMIAGHWRNKHTEYDDFFATFAEAKKALIDRHTQIIAYHKEQLAKSEKALWDAMLMVRADNDPR